MKIKATGAGTLHYQWFHDGAAIPGATSISHTVASAADADRGMYWVQVTDDNGSAIRLVYVNTVPLKTEIFVGPKALHLVERSSTDAVNNAVQVSAAGDTISAVTYEGAVVSWTISGISPDILAGHAVVQAQRDGDSFPTIYLTAAGTAFSSGTPLAAVGDLVRVATFYGAAIGLKGDGTVWNLVSGQPYASSLGTACGIAIAGNAPASPSAVVGDTCFLAALHPDGTFAVTAFNGGPTPPVARGPLLKSLSGCNDTIWAVTRNDEAYMIYSGSSNYSGLISSEGNVRGGAGPNKILLKDGTVKVRYLWTLMAYNFHRHDMEPVDVTQAYALEGNVARSFASITCAGLRDATADKSPAFTAVPVDTQVAEGASLKLTSAVDGGTAEVTYLWYKDGVEVPGVTSADLNLPNVIASDAGDYYVIATNRLGSVQSEMVTVTVNPLLPRLSMTYPVRRYYGKGETLNLGVSATGTGSLSYQWALNGSAIFGATAPTFETVINGPEQTGYYTVTVTDAVGKRTGVMPIHWAPGWTKIERVLNNANPPLPETETFLSIHDAVAFTGTSGSYALHKQGIVDPVVSDYFGSPVAFYGVYQMVDFNVVSPDGRVYNRSLKVAGGENVVDIATLGGSLTRLAMLKSDGTLTAVDVELPSDPLAIQLPHGLREVVAVKSVGGNALILKADGTLLALADGSTSVRSVPTDLTDVVEIFVTTGANFALKRDGSLVAWDYYGRLTLPSSWNGVKRVVEADDTLGIKADGTVVGLGRRLNPSSVLGYTGVVDVAYDSYRGEPLVLLGRPSERPPQVASFPKGLTQASGTSAALTVALASGMDPLSVTYQWSRNGVAISGATGSELAFASLSAGDAGNYTVVISNANGSVTSRPAVVTVATPKPSRLFNISARGIVSASEKMVMGFVVTGAPRQLLVRATGPALGNFGIKNFVLDPALTVHHSEEGTDTIIGSDNNWGDDGLASSLTAVFGSVGAFPLTDESSLDAALVTTAAGANTVVIDAPPPFLVDSISLLDPPMALAEVYDAQLDGDSRLVNFSARNFSGNVYFHGVVYATYHLIAGFAINGNVPKKVLIRAVGPSLAPFGVPSILNDPKLELHATISGVDTVLASNDDWVTESGAADVFSQVGAFPLPEYSKDSAILYELPPGTYSAVVSQGPVATYGGEVLVEVYEVPDGI